jgi:hypothetical protein
LAGRFLQQPIVEITPTVPFGAKERLEAMPYPFQQERLEEEWTFGNVRWVRKRRKRRIVPNVWFSLLVVVP